MPEFQMIEIEISERTGTFCVTSFDDKSDAEVRACNRSRNWPEAINLLLSYRWEPYSCVYVPGTEHPIRHYFKRQLQSLA